MSKDKVSEIKNERGELMAVDVTRSDGRVDRYKATRTCGASGVSHRKTELISEVKNGCHKEVLSTGWGTRTYGKCTKINK